MLYKYPRTYHLNWSEGITNDDKVLTNTKHFEGQIVSVTEKMDGENTTLYTNHIHARSLDSSNHISRDWVKSFWGSIRKDIPESWRICGENLFAEHSLAYKSLPSYFLGFSLWINEVCQSREETLLVFNLLGITPVPELYLGPWDENLIKGLYKEGMEGYVVRNINAFNINDFKYNVAKFVRKNHVQTDNHWMYKEVKQNGLRGTN